MRRLAPILFCLLLSGQNAPPTFRTSTQVVEFTVVAVDKKGNPAVDLKKEEFTLLDGGKQREIAFFRYEGGADAPAGAARPAMPPHVFSNRLELAGASARNLTAIVIDSANIDITDQMMVKAQALRFLRALPPQTLVAVFQFGRDLRIIHDFTDDLGSLHVGLAKLKLEMQTQMPADRERLAREADVFLTQLEARNQRTPVAGTSIAGMDVMRSQVMSEMRFAAAVQGDRVERSMRMLNSLGTHLASIPGRKSLVWITGGIGEFVLRSGPNSQFVGPAAAESLQNALRRTSQRLAQSGVVLYAMDARRLTSPGGGLSQDTRAAFDVMTSTTGGRHFMNTTDLSEAFRKSQSDARGTYLLGFYADGEADGKWRSLKATVQRPGVALFHRQGYQMDPAMAQGPEWSPERWQGAFRNPLGSAAIRLNAHCIRVAGAEAGAVMLTLQIETEDLLLADVEGRRKAELEVAIGEKNSEGALRFQRDTIRLNLTPQQAAVALERGIPYRKQWKPGDDTAVVRVLVRDKATDRYGTVEVKYD